MPDQQITEEWHKPITREFKERQAQSSFVDNICGADLTVMQLVSKFNKWISFLKNVINIFSK